MAINASSAQSNPDSGDTRSFPSAHSIILVNPTAPETVNSWAHLWNSACNKSITYWAVISGWNDTYTFKAGSTTKAEAVLWPGLHIARVNHHDDDPNTSFTSYLYKNGASPATGPAYTIGE
jgi:hypothetical protein